MPDLKPDVERLKRMVRVPAGTFLFGALRTAVHLDEFWIDRYPVTNAEFAQVVAEHRYTPHRATHPVTWASWNAARDYLVRTGLQLPTREQWEKTARGVDGRLYPWGDDHDPRRFNVFESDIRETTPVDRYADAGASPCGAIDMAGNVWEWTLTLSARTGSPGRVVCGGSYDVSWFEMQSGVGTYDILEPANGYATVGFRGVWIP